MQRRSFYEIPEAAWIYVPKRQAKEEEPVRQWCAHELIRAYGYRVTSMTFESPVQVGSKTYWIDILIHHEGKPWICVECKKRGHAKNEAAMEQAISYAASQRVKAEYVLYTNGDVWQVKRNIRNGWVDVLDIPHASHLEGSQVTDHLWRLKLILPVLAPLPEASLKGRAAVSWLHRLQEMFNGMSFWCRSADPRLLDSADNLLRYLADPGEGVNYRLGKLAHACLQLRELVKDRAKDQLLLQDLSGSHEKELMRWMHLQAHDLVEVMDVSHVMDAQLLRVIVDLAQYGEAFPRKESHYPALPNKLGVHLWEYLDGVLRAHFGLKLPSTQDEIRLSDLRGYCAP